MAAVQGIIVEIIVDFKLKFSKDAFYIVISIFQEDM